MARNSCSVAAVYGVGVESDKRCEVSVCFVFDIAVKCKLLVI